MLLSKKLFNFIKKGKNNKNILNKLNLFKRLEKLTCKIKYLKQVKKKNIKYVKIFYEFNYLITNSNSLNNLIKIFFNNCKKKYISTLLYVVTIKFSSTNTLIYFSDIKGNIKKIYSAGSVNLQGKQKIKRYVSFINILKQILIETKSIYKVPITLNLKNITKNYSIKQIIKLLKNNFTIISIISFNSKPHNGCRPKKLRRLK